MKLEIESLSHIGTRENNEDYFAVKSLEGTHYFVVADGLGGHEGGEYASLYFCEAFIENVSKYPILGNQNLESALDTLIHSAATEMAESLVKAELFHAGTTAVIAVLNEKYSLFAHLGDSRIYRLNSEKILWHTKDHSYVQSLVDAGKLSESEAKRHPMRNQISNCITTQSFGHPAIERQDPLKKGESIVLCTDGFWEPLEDKELLGLSHTSHLKAGLNTIFERILKEEKHADNITAIVVRHPHQNEI